MIKTNEEMRRMLKNTKSEAIASYVETIAESICNRTKLVRDCIIYDEDDSLDEANIDFEKVIELAGDLTGYEINCNEIRLEKKGLDIGHLVYLAEKIQVLLEEKYERKLIVIAYVTELAIDIRFHTYREHEGFWMDSNLERYKVPVLCKI